MWRLAYKCLLALWESLHFRTAIWNISDKGNHYRILEKKGQYNGIFFLSSHSDKQVSVAIAWFYPLETAGQTIQDNILTPKS